MQDSGYTPPITPSINPLSNIEIQEIEDWIINHFQRNSIPASLEFVSVSAILSSLPPFDGSAVAQENEHNTEDQILKLCRSKFLETCGYHFDQHSVGGSTNFVPINLLNQAFEEAQQETIQRCQKICGDKKYDKAQTARLVDTLQNFIKHAKIIIANKNQKNCFRYLERNKRNEIKKFSDTVTDIFKFLFQAPRTRAFHFYYSDKMTVDLKLIVSKVVQNWNNIKSIALSKTEGSDDNIRILGYNDDMESSINRYMEDILSANKTRNENFLQNKLRNGFAVCKRDIERTIKEAKFLDDIKLDHIKKHVTFHEQFLQDMNKILPDCTTHTQLSCQLEEKELLIYGQLFLNMEIEKAREAFHEKRMADIKKIFEKLPDKRGLKRVNEIYLQLVVKALEDAKKQCDSNVNVTNNLDKKNTRIETSSPGVSTSRESITNCEANNPDISAPPSKRPKDN